MASDNDRVTAVAGELAPCLALQRAPGFARLSAGGNLPTSELAPYLAPQRAGDPLGLGLTPDERPPPPPDPDEYDRRRENEEYARSLLGEAERHALDEEVEKGGYMTIARVREIVAENTVKSSVASGLDPELIALIDASINYKIFVVGDNIYTREELYGHYPFHEFGVQPEAIFVQQELGVFPPRKHALQPEELEYAARDVGDESVEFIMIEDLVGMETRKDYKMRRRPLRIVKTKVYIGKERWEDFALLQRIFRGAIRVATAQIAASGGRSPLMPGVFNLIGALTSPTSPMIADQATLDAEAARREAEAARREAEVARREAEMASREAEQRRLAEETQRRLDADIKRIEAMLAAAGGITAPPAAGGITAASAAGGITAASAAGGITAPPAAGGITAPPAASAACRADPEDDSVPL